MNTIIICILVCGDKQVKRSTSHFLWTAAVYGNRCGLWGCLLKHYSPANSTHSEVWGALSTPWHQMRIVCFCKANMENYLWRSEQWSCFRIRQIYWTKLFWWQNVIFFFRWHSKRWKLQSNVSVLGKLECKADCFILRFSWTNNRMYHYEEKEVKMLWESRSMSHLTMKSKGLWFLGSRIGPAFCHMASLILNPVKSNNHLHISNGKGNVLAWGKWCFCSKSLSDHERIRKNANLV